MQPRSALIEQTPLDGQPDGPPATAPAGLARRRGPVSEVPGRSPLHDALERVGDRWSLAVVRALLDGPRRFSELESMVEGVSPTILSRRLGQLEADGLVVARPYSSRPVRHRYELTDLGLGLAPIIDLLIQWGARAGTETASVLPATGTHDSGVAYESPDDLFYA